MRFVFVSILAVTALYGQADRGSVSGLVTDPTGAAVPNVAISITHDATNLSLATTSGAGGTYTIPNLPVGIYSLKAEAPGFRRQEVKNIQVQVNQQSKVDIGLQVGEVNSTVEVQASASLIQTESTDVGTVIDNRRFLDLPLTLGGGIRNPSAFIFLTPGVSPGNTWEKHIGGGGSFNDQIYYDGIALSRGDLANDAEVNPSVESVAEFKLITNNYSAEYTHALSGVTSFTMKSGTNQLHGSAFEFLANDKLDARGFFNPVKAPRKQNEWGFTAGGPVLLPKVYNGRDKTFWFFSLDQFYIRGGQLAGFNTLPTTRMLQGDFGEWPGAIYDPRTTSVDAAGRVTRTPFANNLIPKSSFSAVTSKMLPYHPAPELPGITNNSIAPLGSPSADQRTAGFKIDHALRSNHRLSGMFNYTDRPSIKSPAPSRLLSVGRSTALENYNFQVVTTRIIRLNYDWSVSPTLLNHMGAGFSRFRNPNFSLSFNQGWVQPNGGKLGLPGLQSDLFPTVMFTQSYTRFGDDIASDNYFTTLAFLDNLTWIRNKHTVKMGFEVQAHRDNYRNYGNGGGTFNFSQLETALPGVANSGNAFASFLLGAVDSSSAYFRDSLPGGRYKFFGLFIDDTYKMTSRLTWNLGLRWEVQVPTSDPVGRISYMDPSVPNPGASNLPGAYVFGGEGAGRQGFNRFFDIHWMNFAPRVGFAYSFGKSVLRGGYGIFYKEYINQGVGIPQTGFSISPSFSSADSGLTPAFYWDSGFPQNFNRPPLISPTVANGQVASIVEKATGGMIPYAQQWNLTLERQLTNSLMVSGAYVGNKGTHLYDSLQVNQVNPVYYGLGDSVLRANISSDAARSAGVREPFAGFAAALRKPRDCRTGPASLPAIPGRQLRGLSLCQLDVSLVPVQARPAFRTRIRLHHRLHVFQVPLGRVGFTDAHGGVIRQNYFQREKALYATDQPHILSFSFNYALPFGRGSGVWNKIIGGWSTGGFASYARDSPGDFD